MPRPGSSNARLAVGLALGIALVGALPISFLVIGKTDTSKPLPANNRIRGAYVNTQSNDIGPDRPL